MAVIGGAAFVVAGFAVMFATPWLACDALSDVRFHRGLSVVLVLVGVLCAVNGSWPWAVVGGLMGILYFPRAEAIAARHSTSEHSNPWLISGVGGLMVVVGCLLVTGIMTPVN